MKKEIIITNDFYNQENLEYIKQYVDNTKDMLEEIYWKLGGLENCEILTQEEMIALYNFVDLLRDCEVKEV